MSATHNDEPGWLGTAGGALLLVVVGFGVGLLAGTAFEAPDLVIDQLAGRGERVPVEEVDLSGEADLPAVSTPSVDAPPPGDFARVTPPDPPVAATTAPPPPGFQGPGYSVQVGAFADAVAARALATSLRAAGLPGHVVEVGSAPWRVRVGPYRTEAEARRVAEGLQAERELPTWLVRVEGS